MEKALSFIFIACSVAAGLFACSSSDSPSTFGNGGQDPSADSGTISPIVPDQSAGDASANAAAKCDPAIPPSYSPTWTAPTKAVACQPEDITGYYDNCIKNIADPSSKTTCATWTAAHTACTSCLEPTDKSGPYQWYDSSTQTRIAFTINVAGCIAIEQNKMAATDCGGVYAASVDCQRASCATCLDTGGSWAQFRTCEQAVKQQGICKSYETQASATCTDLTKAGAPTLNCFQGSTEAQDVFFQRMETIFCGQ
jgi:hypothetical protein